MRMIIGLLLISAVALKGDEGFWGVEEEKDVAILTAENFDDFIKKHPKVLVKFFAPWCTHCKEMAPEYSKMAAKFKKENPEIVIAQVDAAAHSELGQKNGVKGFPTLKYYLNGEPIDYKGERKEKEMTDFVKNLSKKIKLKEITDLAAAEKLEKEKLAVLAVFPENDEVSKKRFEVLSINFEKVPFYYTTNDKVKEHYDLRDNYGMIVFRNFDDGKKILTNKSPLAHENIRSFLDAVRFPLVMEFDQEAAEKIFQNQLNTIFVFTESAKSPILKEFREVAEKYQKDIQFANCLYGSEHGPKLSEYLGVKMNDEGAIKLIEFGGKELKKYECKGKTAKEIEKCVTDFKDKKLKQVYKSEETPKDNTAPVKILTGNTFKEIVLDNDNHVLVEIYAPWCGHCKKLAPIYDELAKKLSTKFKDIVIAKMDGTLNEYPGIEIKGYPTLKLYKRGEKSKPIDVDAERSLKGLLEFLEKQTKQNVLSVLQDTDEL